MKLLKRTLLKILTITGLKLAMDATVGMMIRNSFQLHHRNATRHVPEIRIKYAGVPGASMCLRKLVIKDFVGTVGAKLKTNVTNFTMPLTRKQHRKVNVRQKELYWSPQCPKQKMTFYGNSFT